MKAETKTRINQIARTAITVDVIVYAILLVAAILLFFGYAIYSAAHHVRF